MNRKRRPVREVPRHRLKHWFRRGVGLEESDRWIYAKVVERRDPKGMPWWMRLREDGYLENSRGGRMPPEAYQMLQFVAAYGLEDLDWTGTIWANPKSTHGWLDRSGNFYGCPYAGHNFCAEVVLRRYSRELEEEGWIKVNIGPEETRTPMGTRCLPWSMGLFGNVRTPSAEQLNWLRRRGYDVEDW